MGDEVDAYVLRVDRENRRIGLSLRLTEPDPWQTAEQTYAVGQLITGTVTKMIAFGAFAALDDGIEGLIHISELADDAPQHPSEVVSQGQVLPLKVVKVDSARRRMGLSLKSVTAEEWAKWEECHKAKEEASADTAPVEAPALTPDEELAAQEVSAEETSLDVAPGDQEEELAAQEVSAEETSLDVAPGDQAQESAAPEA